MSDPLIYAAPGVAAPPSYADILSRCHAAEARVAVLESQQAWHEYEAASDATIKTLRDMLKAVTRQVGTVSAYGGLMRWCVHCSADLLDGAHITNPALHNPACPWRQAVEYLAGLEGHQ